MPKSAEIARSERVRPPRHGRFQARRTTAPVRWDAVGDGALVGRCHWAGAKVRAAEFMQ